MTLAIKISPQTEAWLQSKANAVGADKESVASRVLDQAAERDLLSLPKLPEERLRRFRTWVGTIAARPGPQIDTSRENIYE